MMRRGIAFALLLAAFALCLWLRKATAVSVPISVPRSKAMRCERLVSLAPSITETLFALDLGQNVKGVTRYCAYPKQVLSLPKVGGYTDPSLSAVIRLKPTLVVLLDEHMEFQKKLRALGIDTLELANHRTADILRAIDTVGRACGKEDAARAVLDDIRTREIAVRRRARGKPRPKVMITMGRSMGSGGLKDVFIAGGESYYQDLIELSGGTNVYRGKVPFPVISKEGMMQLNPEVIIDMVPDMKKNGWDKAALKNEWADLDVEAVRTGRTHVFDGAYTVVPGPRFILTLEEIAAVLHPSSKKEGIQ